VANVQDARRGYLLAAVEVGTFLLAATRIIRPLETLDLGRRSHCRIFGRQVAADALWASTGAANFKRQLQLRWCCIARNVGVTPAHWSLR
jgi:hypothetical protein